jgi:hypothetical protein
MVVKSDHLHFEVETSAGDLIRVLLDNPANVQLMDLDNYKKYVNREQFRYRGGYATPPWVEFRPPSPGAWHVVIDLGGGPGKVRASIQVIPEGWKVFNFEE